jgi:hypothetical protein
MRWRALPAFAAIDFVCCLLVVFVAVAMTSRPPQVKTFGSYAVVITWPSGPDDVDLYVRDPAGAIAFFGRTQIDQLQLEHDDLGTKTTSYGRDKANEERTIIRSATPGQWVVDTHLYRRTPGTGSTPIPVTVSLWDLRSEDHLLEQRRVTLVHQGDERTPFRFTIDARGNVAGYSFVPVGLVQSSTTFMG